MYIKTKLVLSTCPDEVVGNHCIWQNIRGRDVSRLLWFFTPPECFTMNSLLAIDILIKRNWYWRGPQQGKIASKISEILKISRVVYDKIVNLQKYTGFYYNI